MRIEYKFVSSKTGGLYETYLTREEYRERYYYIFNHKDEFKDNSMIYCYKYYYNEEGKITKWDTISIIKF